MPAFVRIWKPPPVELFAATITSSRFSLKSAYQNAFDAADRRTEKMRPMYWEDDSAQNDPLTRLGIRKTHSKGEVEQRETLRFGPLYRNSARLTSLLRATTNCVRHVSEWDDDETLSPPYETGGKRELASISVLKKTLGFGMHERVWVAPCFDIDGLYGRHPIDYNRCEKAVLEAAREIIKEGDPSLLPLLEKKLTAE